MHKAARFVSALGAVFFAVFAIAACGSSTGVPGNAVANIDGTLITQNTFKHWVAVAAVSGASGQITGHAFAPEPPEYTKCIQGFEEVQKVTRKGKTPLTHAALKAQCESAYKGYVQEVMAFLTSSQWVLGEANDLGVHVTDAEVHKQFIKIKSGQFPKASEFEKFLASSGQTISDLLLRVKLNMLSSKIQTKISKKGTVSSAEVQKYYNENKSRFGSPEKRNVSIILTKTEAQAKAAKKEVESGKSFASVANAVSIDPTSKKAGGLLSEVVKGQQALGLDNAIFSATKGVLGGPVQTAFGYYVYRVEGIIAGTQQSLSQVKKSIESQLVSTKQQDALTKFVKNFKAKWKAKTNCGKGFVAANCKQFKASKTAEGAG